MRQWKLTNILPSCWSFCWAFSADAVGESPWPLIPIFILWSVLAWRWSYGAQTMRRNLRTKIGKMRQTNTVVFVANENPLCKAAALRRGCLFEMIDGIPFEMTDTLSFWKDDQIYDWFMGDETVVSKWLRLSLRNDGWAFFSRWWMTLPSKWWGCLSLWDDGWFSFRKMEDRPFDMMMTLSSRGEDWMPSAAFENIF